MPPSFESVLSTCVTGTIASLRARAGINMAPSVSVEGQARVVVEWCLENDITPDELWALADNAAWHKDSARVSTYTEQAPSYAAALATLSRALGEGDAIDALGNARAFVANVAAELMAFRKREQRERELESELNEVINNREAHIEQGRKDAEERRAIIKENRRLVDANKTLENSLLGIKRSLERVEMQVNSATDDWRKERDLKIEAIARADRAEAELKRMQEAAPGQHLLQHLRAIPLKWRLLATWPESIYDAAEGRLTVQVYRSQHGINSAHITIAELGSDCVSFEAPDEAPFIIRHLIGKLAINNLDQLTVDEIKACVPPWAQHHVHRQIEDEVMVFRRSRERLENAALGLQADSTKRLALSEKLKTEWCEGAK